MALVSRAERVTVLGQQTTPDAVGPGSYLSTASKPAAHGYAPFCSTAQRSSSGQTAVKAATPGPGTYGGNAVGGNARGANAAFSSKVARVAGAAKEGAPGPGQYTLKDEWRKSGRGGSHSAPGVGGSRVRAAATNPPSIPAQDQSFGYEESATGELLRQMPPPGGYTGVSGRASVGPGEYDYSMRLTKPHNPAATFGNSRVQRQVFGAATDAPGPGAYAQTAQPSSKGGAGSRGSSNFMSRVARAHQQTVDADRVGPGPGAYAHASTIAPKATAPHLQSFGSTQKRLASDAPTPSERARLAQPGPGAYEPSNPLHARAAAQPDPAAVAEPRSASAFNSSVQRFKPLRKTGDPGPGAYDELDQHTFVSDLQRRTHGKHGVFGSTTRRFHSLKKDTVPGAGAYDPAPVAAPKEESSSSAFASNTSRFTSSAKAAPAEGGSGAMPKGAAATPPPWQYSIKSANDWDRRGGASRKPNQHFGTTVERFAEGAQAKAVAPGPGAYDARDPNRDGFRKQRSTFECFGSKEVRSLQPPAKLTPGPGAYESSVGTVDPLVRRSYNITLG